MATVNATAVRGCPVSGLDVSSMPVREVPGRYAFNPLTGVQATARHAEEYMLSRQAEAGGAPVFKAHPGVRAIAITDMTSARFFYSCPPSTLDRGPRNTFGPMVAGHVGRSFHMLCTGGHERDAGRAFLDQLLQQRDARLFESLEYAYGECTRRWVERRRFNMCAAMSEFCLSVMFHWLFDAPLDPKHLSEAAFDEFHYVGSTRTSSWFINKFVIPLVPLKMSDEVKAAREYLPEVIRQSERFSEYREMAAACGVPVVDFEHFLCSVSHINGNAARMLLWNTLAQVKVNVPVRERLLEDLQRVPALNRESLLDGVPWLDAIFREGKRLYPRPRWVFRVASQDFLMPAGDGNAYAIKKGNGVVALNPFIYRDVQVFGDTSGLFLPQRFLDRPELTDLTELTFGWTGGAENAPFHCPARGTRQAELIIKFALARLIRDFEWEFTETPRFRPNYYTEVNPDLTIDDFRRKSANGSQ